MDAVLVGTVRLGDGNLSVPDGNGIASGGVLNKKFLVPAQVHNLHNRAPGGNPGIGSRRVGEKKQNAQPGAYSKNRRQKQDPEFGFQTKISSISVSPGARNAVRWLFSQYTRNAGKTQEKVRKTP